MDGSREPRLAAVWSRGEVAMAMGCIVSWHGVHVLRAGPRSESSFLWVLSRPVSFLESCSEWPRRWRLDAARWCRAQETLNGAAVRFVCVAGDVGVVCYLSRWRLAEGKGGHLVRASNVRLSVARGAMRRGGAGAWGEKSALASPDRSKPLPYQRAVGCVSSACSAGDGVGTVGTQSCAGRAGVNSHKRPRRCEAVGVVLNDSLSLQLCQLSQIHASVEVEHGVQTLEADKSREHRFVPELAWKVGSTQVKMHAGGFQAVSLCPCGKSTVCRSMLSSRCKMLVHEGNPTLPTIFDNVGSDFLTTVLFRLLERVYVRRDRQELRTRTPSTSFCIDR